MLFHRRGLLWLSSAIVTIVKRGFTGVVLFFLFLLQNIDCGCSLEPPRLGSSNVYPQAMFGAKIRKNVKMYLPKIFIFTTLKVTVYCMDMFS